MSACKQIITVAALYRFTRFEDCETLRRGLLAACERLAIRGTIILAHEGINGTIAGATADIEAVLGHIRGLPGCDALEVKCSAAETNPFYRMKVRLKKEIVSMGVAGIDARKDAGTHVRPQDWNALLADPEVVLIDTRNAYEVAIGSFPGAINPETASFREFPGWARNNPALRGKSRIAMFCTGGIRCEKASAFVKGEGIGEVYHLQGGILKYLKTVPEHESQWQGECFVFDQRVAVGHGLRQGSHAICHACRHPLGPEDVKSELHVAGSACPHCHDRNDAARRKRYQERQRQMELAEARGESHLGAKMQPRPGSGSGKS